MKPIAASTRPKGLAGSFLFWRRKSTPFALLFGMVALAMVLP